MSGRPRQPAPTAAEELRELTREAHAVIKDLRAASLEARRMIETELGTQLKAIHNEYNDRVKAEALRYENELVTAAAQLRESWERDQEQREQAWNETLRQLRGVVTRFLANPEQIPAMIQRAPEIITIRSQETE